MSNEFSSANDTLHWDYVEMQLWGRKDFDNLVDQAVYPLSDPPGEALKVYLEKAGVSVQLNANL